MYRLFVVEDDPGIAAAIITQAEQWGMSARAAQNFRHVAEEFAEFSPHIALLDISLPCYDGYYWCGEIRKISKTPIIFISSASDNMNIIMAMNMGADDFIAKPFDQSVLMAKINALLRRTYDFAANISVMTHRGAILNSADGTLVFNGEQVPLSKNEFKILLCLMENRGRVVSREKLMERLWKTDEFIDENTLTVNVNRLRKRLEAVGLSDFIVTKHGVGYTVG